MPDVLLWLDATNGTVVGPTVAHPGEILDVAPRHLLETMGALAVGPPRSPARVRVASETLAASLGAALPALEVVVVGPPTPRSTRPGPTLRRTSRSAPRSEAGSPTACRLPAVGAFFEAMAALWRAAPWEAVAGGKAMLSVSIEAFGVRDAVAVVIWELCESFGVRLFDSIADRDRFVALGTIVRDGCPAAATALSDEIGMPAQAGLSFDPMGDGWPRVSSRR